MVIHGFSLGEFRGHISLATMRLLCLHTMTKYVGKISLWNSKRLPIKQPKKSRGGGGPFWPHPVIRQTALTKCGRMDIWRCERIQQREQFSSELRFLFPWSQMRLHLSSWQQYRKTPTHYMDSWCTCLPDLESKPHHARPRQVLESSCKKVATINITSQKNWHHQSITSQSAGKSK